MKKLVIDKNIESQIIESFKSGHNITQLVAMYGPRRLIERTILNAGLTLKTKSELIAE